MSPRSNLAAFEINSSLCYCVFEEYKDFEDWGFDLRIWVVFLVSIRERRRS